MQRDDERDPARLRTQFPFARPGNRIARRRSRLARIAQQRGHPDAHTADPSQPLLVLSDKIPTGINPITYDKEGNRVFKMSLPDKALLAKWKEFDSLAPSEQMAILKEFADTHIPKDEKESAGEKFAKVIDYLVEFLIALFKSPADAEETPAKKAA